MARRFLDDIRADIATLLPDNTSGLITPAIVRSILTDIVDSEYSDEGGMTGGEVLGVTVTGTPTPLSIFNTEIGALPGFITPNSGAGTITCSSTAGFTYSVYGVITFEADNNEPITLNITTDGIPRSVFSTGTGRGPGRPITLLVEGLVLSTPPNAVMQLTLNSDGSTEQIDILSSAFFVTIDPTNNP
jgi:hypothetical protein